MKRKLTAAVLLAAFGFAASAQQPQGVTKTDIVVGSIQDLSGPIAAFGKQARNGLQMRADEINEAGGVNGRKIKLLVEDHGYDPRRGVLAAQKLVQNDKVFAMLGNIGTPTNMAALPIQLERNVVNWLPLTAAREMYEPFNRYKFALLSSYYDQMRIAVPWIVKQGNYKRVCINYQDDEFGLDVLRGVEAALKSMNMDLAERASYKRGATDFSSQVARLRAANCEVVVLGTIIRETVGTIGEARKLGWNPVFLGSAAAYTDLIHKLGKGAVEGMYTTHTVAHPYEDDPSPLVRKWAAAYKAKFNEEATVFSVYGYVIMDTFGRTAAAAGDKLTTDTFIAAAEKLQFTRDIFGSPGGQFGKDRRLADNTARISRIVGGRWVVQTDYMAPPK